MGRERYTIFMLPGDPDVFIYTCARSDCVLNLIDELGFRRMFTLYSYGWSVSKGYVYSLPEYFEMVDPDRMVKLMRMNNGTEEKLKIAYQEVCSAENMVRKRWWQYYRKQVRPTA